MLDTANLLLVSSCENDHVELGNILRECNWEILRARSCREASESIRQHSIGVIVCDRYLLDGSWRDILDETIFLSQVPLLIVTARHGDDVFWAELLDSGGYDLIAKPFDPSEVARIISLAFDQLHAGQRALQAVT